MVIIMFRLKYFRNRKGITQKEIAEEMNISRSTYSGYENGNDNIPLEKMNCFCEHFKISLDYLTELSEINNFKSCPTINANDIGKRLNQFLENNNITQTELAKVLNISTQTIFYYIHGRTIIQSQFLYEICKKYNISMDYIVGRSKNINIE